MKDPKALIEHSNNMQNVYKNIEEYNPTRKCNVLIVFDDMIADMISNKKLNQIITKLFIRGRKLNISTACVSRSYFKVPKYVRLNCKHIFILKISDNEKQSSTSRILSFIRYWL